MFSRILVKLIDQAIIPAISLVAVRIVSVLLIAKYFGINYSITSAGFYFSTQEEYIKVNSYSTLLMISFLALGISFILIKSYVFHDSHITPGLTAHLFALKIPSFIQNSYEIYSQGIIWLSYNYLLLIITLIMTLFGFMYMWVFYLTLGITILSTVLFILDIELELNISRSKEPSLDKDKSYLEAE